MNQQHEACMLLRAVSGAQAADIIRKAQQLAQNAKRVEVSLASPCSESTHRALTGVGVAARVEPLHAWVERIQAGAHAYVVGPGRAAAAAWRRLACELMEDARRTVSEGAGDRRRLVECDERVECFA